MSTQPDNLDKNNKKDQPTEFTQTQVYLLLLYNWIHRCGQREFNSKTDLLMMTAPRDR